MRMLYAAVRARGLIIRPMNESKERTSPDTRVLSLTLPESEWRNLLNLEPEPIAWLRDQIRERLDDRGALPREANGRPADACAHPF